MKLKMQVVLSGIVFVTVLSLAASVQEAPVAQSAPEKFEVSFPASAHAGAITGRVFVMITKNDTPEPRLQAGGLRNIPPIFGINVNEWAPGRAVIVEDNTPGYPLRSLHDIPEDDYYVQALVNIYTEFHRSDGHTIWAHMDQWEGQPGSNT